MSGIPARALGVAAWVAVVAVGAVLVWLVISRAGGGLLADAGPVTAPSGAPVAGDGSSTAAPGVARRGTWQGEVGLVTASCRRGAIALVGAQPEDGAVVRVKDQGPEQVVVAFDGDDEGPITVVGTCRDGRPQFTVTAGSSAETADPSPSDAPTSEGSDDGSGSEQDSGHGSDDGPSDTPGDD